MPHRYTKEDTIKRLEDDIKTCDSSIRRMQEISTGNLDSLKSQIKDFLETAKEKKNNALDLMELNSKGDMYPAGIQEKAAHLARGQEKAFEIVLDMLENPSHSIDFYENDRKRLIEDLEKYRSYELRPAN